MVLPWFLVRQTIGTNGFAMVFGPATIDADGFEVRQPINTMVFQWFPKVANHWYNVGIVTIHCHGLPVFTPHSLSSIFVKVVQGMY